MAHIRIAVFLNSHCYADVSASEVAAQTEIPVDSIITQKSVTDYEVLTDVDAFVTANGKWIEIDQLCWLNMGKTKSDCKAIFLTLLKCFYIEACKGRQQILIVDCHI